MILLKLNKEEEYKIEEIYNMINNSLTIMLFTINYFYQKKRSIEFIFSFLPSINDLIYSENPSFSPEDDVLFREMDCLIDFLENTLTS